jgi:quinoprotein glucose dehydrogenase
MLSNRSWLLSALIIFSAGRFDALAASSAANDEWPAYGNDGGGTRHSPLTQINPGNIKDLKIAWVYQTGEGVSESRAGKKAAFEATPILVDGTLFFSTPFNRVIALDPLSGKEKWRFEPNIDTSGNFSEVTSRGVSTWSGKDGRRRIYLGTIDARLIALDARTGQRCKDFGKGGEVDLTKDVRFISRGDYQVTSPPAVIGNLLIVGSAIADNRGVKLERGVVRAYDAKSGKLQWSWDPIPTDKNDPARKTWEGESAANTGGANAWSIISVDPERDLVFVPTGSPSPDFYGGERRGHNLYANSVVALHAKTGKLLWHFQAVHHDLWDYDVASQPTLVTVKRNGSAIPAVAVGTKVGHVFILDRMTGRPLFPVEERAVPQSDVPGEAAAATQPFPTLPPPLVPQKLTPEDAWGPTEADCDWCRERIKALRSEGAFTPPSLGGSILFPGNIGGMHWGGASYDPARGLLIANVNRIATVVKLIPRTEYEAAIKSEGHRLSGEYGPQRGTPYGMYREFLLSPSGTPCNAPPWGELVALDVNTGALKWRTPLGMIPRFPQFPKSTEWGSVNLGGSITTAGGLIFAGAAMDTWLRAFDIETGKEIWKAELPASAQATPMSYEAGGKQYIVIAAGGHGKLGTKLGDYVVAFSLN